jgi:general transcription factor 3C polypeptide 5 (transcription factor C subunit 1)
MLDRLEAPGPMCNERRGWLPFGFDDQCRDILTVIVLENYKNVFKRNLADEQDDGDEADDGAYEQLDEFEEPGMDDTEQDMDIDDEC